MMRTVLLLVLGCSAVACGSTATPTTPTSTTQPARWNLTGRVTGSNGVAINGAVLAILDGPDGGRQASTDVAGRYGFNDLQQAGFSVRVSAGGYATVTIAVTLTANAVADVPLLRLPFAAFTFEGFLVYTARGDGWDLWGTAVNSGDGCAVNVAGITTITLAQPAAPLEFLWNLSPGRRIQAGERFEYAIGHITRDQTAQFNGGSTYSTRFTFTPAICP